MKEFRFIRCNDEKSFSQMHEIREKVLFTSGKYDRHHPDDSNPEHHCFICLLNNIPIATVRLDFINHQEIALRLVGVLPEYQGQKIGSRMLSAVEDYAKQKGITRLVTNSAIDAKKFYESIGFIAENWVDTGEGISQPTIPMVKRLNFNPHLINATMADYPVIQNMARFYAYDMSRYCGFTSSEWDFPKDGLYEAHDFKKYFEEADRKAFLVKIDDELAGFVLLNKIGTLPDTEWDMGEFYVLGKFQGKGIAKQVAYQIWQEFIGKWEVSVIPENLPGLAFWRKTISNFTNGHYKEEIKKVDYDKHQPNRYIFSFDTKDLVSAIDTSAHEKNVESIEIEEIDQDKAEKLCCSITEDLPEYFGIPSANEQYFKGVRSCMNLAAKIGNQYIGLLSLNFPYSNNSNIYWMAVLRDHQGKGIGRRLMKEACQLARKLNATTMTVETLSPDESDDNYLKTWKFYLSAGFKPLMNLKPEGYEWDMVYMVKYLGKGK